MAPRRAPQSPSTTRRGPSTREQHTASPRGHQSSTERDWAPPQPRPQPGEVSRAQPPRQAGCCTISHPPNGARTFHPGTPGTVRIRASGNPEPSPRAVSDRENHAAGHLKGAISRISTGKPGDGPRPWPQTSPRQIPPETASAAAESFISRPGTDVLAEVGGQARATA